MIKSVDNYAVSALLSVDDKVIYTIPRYQREYTWGKWQWDTLFEDLIENAPCYFLGSIICINQSIDTLKVQSLELVDGQQRVTTLSILMAAIYRCYSDLDIDLDEDEIVAKLNLKHKLALKGKNVQARLVPQVQNNNQQDYFWVLKEANVFKESEYPPHAGNRRILRAYRHFYNRITSYLSQSKDSLLALTELIEKVNTATLVKIEVASHSDAYTLFESLNNRGVPLTAIDLIKNKLLSKLESDDEGQIDKHFNNWMKVLSSLGDDYAIQERFFRHNYNAFKPLLKDIANVPVATKSNLIHIYEKLISHNAEKFLNKMMYLSALYAQIISKNLVPEQPKLTYLLKDLDRVQGTPSHLLLLILFAEKDSLNITDEILEKITQLLIAFFVRRNTTDKPATRDLTKIFMDLSSEVTLLKGECIYDLVSSTLIRVSADDKTFIKGLSGNIYDDNKAVCRFVLCAIEQSHMTRETERDLWAVKGNQFVWTIEHIFPQGDNIPKVWVDMMAGGDEILAHEFKDSHVHKLGNLTISGYNSTLGTKSFIEKRDRKDQKGRAVGYNNGLYLNKMLCDSDSWSVNNIDSRTQELVSQVLDLFSLSSQDK